MKFPTRILPALLLGIISQLQVTVKAGPVAAAPPAATDSVIGCDLIILGPPVTVRPLSIYPRISNDPHVLHRLVPQARALQALSSSTTVRVFPISSRRPLTAMGE